MRKISIQTNEQLLITFFTPDANHTITTTDDELYHALSELKGYGPQQDYLELIKHDLKQLHIALSRAIEEGDNLKLGIVLGQSISKIESLINE